MGGARHGESGEDHTEVASWENLGNNKGGNRAAQEGTTTHTPATLTTPSGSTSSRCLGCPLCRPVSTYWPGVVVLSRTRKSPLSCSRASASRRFSFPWNQGSPRSCSAMATDWGGGGTRRASSKGSRGAERGLGEAAGTTPVQDQNLQRGEARKEGEEEPSRKAGYGREKHSLMSKRSRGALPLTARLGGPAPPPACRALSRFWMLT